MNKKLIPNLHFFKLVGDVIFPRCPLLVHFGQQVDKKWIPHFFKLSTFCLLLVHFGQQVDNKWTTSALVVHLLSTCCPKWTKRRQKVDNLKKCGIHFLSTCCPKWTKSGHLGKMTSPTSLKKCKFGINFLFIWAVFCFNLVHLMSTFSPFWTTSGQKVDTTFFQDVHFLSTFSPFWTTSGLKVDTECTWCPLFVHLLSKMD